MAPPCQPVCGVPVAAYPVTGPRDVIGGHSVGVLHDDLKVACLEALKISRAACRDFALSRSWNTSARQFLSHINQVLHPSAADLKFLHHLQQPLLGTSNREAALET